MIIFNRDTKNLSIPKGLGNVSVAVTSGNTDTVSPADLKAALSEERVAIAAQTHEIVEEAAEDLTASYQSADRQVLSDASAYADSAITAAIEENSRQDRAYASQVANSAATEVLQAAEDYTDTKTEQALETIRNEIASADTIVWLNGYTQPWDTSTTDINALWEKVDSMTGATGTGSSTWCSLTVYIRCGGYGFAYPFKISFVTQNLMEVYWVGWEYGHITKLSAYKIYIHRGQPITQADVETHYISFD